MVNRCSNSTNCFEFGRQAIEKHPVRGNILLALAVIALVGLALGLNCAPVHTFFTSTVGKWVIGGSSLVGLALIAWIFYPACSRKSNKNKVKDTSTSSKVGRAPKIRTPSPKGPELRTASPSNKPKSEILKALPSPEIEVEEPIEESFTTSQTFQIPDRLYKTQAGIRALKMEGGLGDYTFKDMGDGLKLMVIKTEGKPISLLVKESSQKAKHYRFIFKSGRRIWPSQLLFTGPQISAMMRLQETPIEGIRISGLTGVTRHKTGLIIFTTTGTEDKKYFIVDEKGVLCDVPFEKLIELGFALHKG